MKGGEVGFVTDGLQFHMVLEWLVTAAWNKTARCNRSSTVKRSSNRASSSPYGNSPAWTGMSTVSETVIP